MAEVTAMRNNALPYPVYGAPWTVVFPMLDADGDLVTGATTPDAEVSKNGDTFADCTNESTEIATASGMYYLTLTGTEMTADIVAVIAKSATAGMKTTALTFYPRKLVTIRSGTSASGGVSTSTIVLDGSASAVDDFYNGMLCVATIDSNVEARIITDYTGSNQTATVVPDWNVAPDNNDTFVIYLPEGVQINQANTTHIAGSVVSTSSAQIGVNVVNAGGTAWGSGAITAGSIAADAITAAKIANGAIDAATFAADVDAEILSYIVNDATQIDASALNTLSSHDPGATLGTSTLTQTQVTGGAYALNSASFAFNAALDLTTTQKASVNTEADTALVDINLDHLVKSAVDTNFATTVHLDSVIGHLADNGTTATFDRTTDSLEVLGAATAPSAASIADAVWDEAIAGHLSAGSTGEALNAAGSAGDPWVTNLPGAYGAGSAGYILGTNLDALVSSRLASASISLSGGAVTVGTNNDKTGYQLSATGVDDIWNEAASGHTSAGTFGRMFYALIAAEGTVNDATPNGTDFDSTLTSGEDFWNDQPLVFMPGTTQAGQARIIYDHDATTGNMQVDEPWTASPSNGDAFLVLAQHGHSKTQITSTVWDGLTAGYAVTGSFGKAVADILDDTGTSGVVVATNNDKTGYTLSASGLSAISTWTVAITGNITGNLSGTVGGVAGTITTLDALDTAQDTQHSTTQAAVAAVQADLPQRITKNVALSNFEFLMVDSADHITGKTGLTITATRSLDGAAFASCANSASEVANGIYKIDLAAADLNGNVVTLKFTASGADARFITIVTQPT